MDDAYVKTSLRSLLSDNESTLVQNFIHQGRDRVIAQIALSNLTPPTGYYYILIVIPDGGEASLVQANPTNVRPRPVTEYEIQMEISDEALVQLGDIEAYEIMTLDFDRLIGRIVQLLRETQWLDGDGRSLKLKRGVGANDRRVEKSNLSGNYFNTEGENVALLYSQLRFTVVDECVDTARLYS